MYTKISKELENKNQVFFLKISQKIIIDYQ